MWPQGFHVLSSTRASLSLSLSLSLSFSLSLSPLLLSFASLVFFTSVGSTLKCCFQRQVTWPIIHRSSCHNNSKIINSSQCQVYNIGSILTLAACKLVEWPRNISMHLNTSVDFHKNNNQQQTWHDVFSK